MPDKKHLDIKRSASLAMIGMSSSDIERLRERESSLLLACSRISSNEGTKYTDTRPEYDLPSLRHDNEEHHPSRDEMLRNAKSCEDGYIKLDLAVIRTVEKESEEE